MAVDLTPELIGKIRALIDDPRPRGYDLYRKTAALLFEVPPHQVTDDQRGLAKILCYGIIWGVR